MTRETDSEKDLGPTPSVYARLRDDADRRWNPRPAPRWARPAGWVVMAGIVVAIVVAVRGGTG